METFEQFKKRFQYKSTLPLDTLTSSSRRSSDDQIFFDINEHDSKLTVGLKSLINDSMLTYNDIYNYFVMLGNKNPKQDAYNLIYAISDKKLERGTDVCVDIIEKWMNILNKEYSIKYIMPKYGAMNLVEIDEFDSEKVKGFKMAIKDNGVPANLFSKIDDRSIKKICKNNGWGISFHVKI